MVAGETCGLRRRAGISSCRDMAICAVAPVGNSSSALLRFSSAETMVAPEWSATAWRVSGRALHHEIEIANPETSQHVAHRAAG